MQIFLKTPNCTSAMEVQKDTTVGELQHMIDNEHFIPVASQYLVAKNGMKYPKYSEKNLSKYLKNKEISISIDVGMGNHMWTVYTCDLTEQYIRINADYRS